MFLIIYIVFCQLLEGKKQQNSAGQSPAEPYISFLVINISLSCYALILYDCFTFFLPIIMNTATTAAAASIAPNAINSISVS